MNKNLILRSAVILVCINFISKFMGFFRETLIAAKFGATYSTDIYTFSDGMVSLLFVSIGAALSTTFIPMLTDHISNKTNEERNKFVNNLITIMVVLSIIISMIGVSLAYFIVYHFAPGFRINQEVFSKSVLVLKIMFLSLVFITLQNIFTGILQAHDNFTVPASIALFSNTIFIIYLIILSKKYGIIGFAVTTVFAYLIQFIIHLPVYKKLGYKYKFVFNLRDDSILRIGKLVIPVLISSSIMQINILVDRIIATNLGEGTLAALNYSSKLQLFIYTSIIVSISSIVYPNLSKEVSDNNLQKFSKMLTMSINSIIIIVIPIVVLTMILCKPIISIVYERGAFDQRAVMLTSLALFYYSPSLILGSMRDILEKAFYSRKDTTTPMKNGILGVCINILLAIVLSRYYGIAGLAIATTASVSVVTILLFRKLRKKILDTKGILRIAIKSGVASLISAYGAYIVKLYMMRNLEIIGFGGNLVLVVVTTFIMLSLYVIIIYFLKIEEFLIFVKITKKAFLKKL